MERLICVVIGYLFGLFKTGLTSDNMEAAMPGRQTLSER